MKLGILLPDTSLWNKEWMLEMFKQFYSHPDMRNKAHDKNVDKRALILALNTTIAAQHQVYDIIFRHKVDHRTIPFRFADKVSKKHKTGMLYINDEVDEVINKIKNGKINKEAEGFIYLEATPGESWKRGLYVGGNDVIFKKFLKQGIKEEWNHYDYKGNSI
ncbi:hypothetical protein [Flammeovirga sp. OC4]|uniref:hypothetical protein n=1 Tax=Flammeovirga sp. OC4 TaxID=1382345 RepID=UPI0012E06F25|nr:hypothetical protein [Flammeovirga sp. OC4]